MRVIMVPVADRPESAFALDVAFGLAERLGAGVTGIHIRPHRDTLVALPPEFGLEVTPQFFEVHDEESVEAASRSARELLGKVAEKHGFELRKKIAANAERAFLWREDAGHPQMVLSIAGPVSDLIVVSRPAKKTSQVARLFLNEALLSTARPVLVLPKRRRKVSAERIVIAWNQSVEAMRTVVAAMPLLRAAESVTLATCGPETRLGPKCKHVIRYLESWGVEAKATRTKGSDVTKELLEAVESNDAGLLVMGAYSRHRLRERIFGGVTRDMLNEADVPLFALHV